ncbi:MAG: YafY family transcriptional regulator [Treponema sp.]|nr:YafY family transcriptional regulator [Treponema sp.]
MQIDQLFEFVYVLIDKKQVTAKEMSERFGVSVRTIYRWIDALCISGVPIYSLKGRGGGIAISENFTLDNTVLTEEERLAILSSLKALDTLSGNNSRGVELTRDSVAASSAFGKQAASNTRGLTTAKASLLTANSSAVQKLSRLVKSDTDWLEVDFAPWSPEGAEVRNLFSTLRDSILKKRQVSFDYFTGDGRTEKRIVHPWKLVFRGQSWYLLGWCTSRKAERYFKLTRMRNVLVTEKTADISRDVSEKLKKEKSKKATNISRDASEELEKVNSAKNGKNAADLKAKNKAVQPQDNISYENFPLVQIKARVSKEKISYLLDSFICSQLDTHKDGSVTATFTAPESPWLCELLLGFGPQIKIISPKKIKKQIIELSSAVLKIYKNK